MKKSLPENKARILVFVEKPSCALAIGDALRKNYPDAEIKIVYIFSKEHGIKVDLQEKNDAEFLDPVYYPRKAAIMPFFNVHSNGHLSSLESMSNEEFNLVFHDEAWLKINACDSDYVGVIGFYNFIKCASAENLDNLKNVKTLLIKDYSEQEIIQSLKSMQDFDHPEIQALLNFGKAKRYFDFNWNRLSIKHFRPVFYEMGIGYLEPEYTVSKYGLQFLYELKSMSSMTESGAFSLMHRCNYGTPMSRWLIMENLKNARLLNTETTFKLGSPGAFSKIWLSEVGVHFLNTIGDTFKKPELKSDIDALCQAAAEKDSDEWKQGINSYLANIFKR